MSRKDYYNLSLSSCILNVNNYVSSLKMIWLVRGEATFGWAKNTFTWDIKEGVKTKPLLNGREIDRGVNGGFLHAHYLPYLVYLGNSVNNAYYVVFLAAYRHLRCNKNVISVITAMPRTSVSAFAPNIPPVLLNAYLPRWGVTKRLYDIYYSSSIILNVRVMTE